MHKPALIVDPGHGGLSSSFYDMDNGVQLSYTWEEVSAFDGDEKRYFSVAEHRRWRAGELAREPRFYFERKGRRITWGDPGCLSPLDPRICEKDLMLDVARSLHRLVERDVVVKLTRDRDGYVAEKSRIHCARRTGEKQAGATALVSLHAEADGDPAFHGFRICRAPGRGLALAEQLRQTLGEHLRSLGERGFCDEIVKERLPLLEEAEMPAVRVELGFLSNLEDAGRLLDRHMRQDLARVLARDLEQFVLALEPRKETEVVRSLGRSSVGLSQALA